VAVCWHRNRGIAGKRPDGVHQYVDPAKPLFGLPHERARALAAGKVGDYDLVTQVIAAVCNLAVFAALIEAVPRLVATPVVPLAAGAVLGAFVNYGGSTWWVFRHKPRPN